MRESKPSSSGGPATPRALAGSAAGASVRVEIEAETLLDLLRGRPVCAADLRCLDCESKRRLWQLCLRACLQAGPR